MRKGRPMRYASAAVVLAVVLGALALFLPRSAPGQSIAKDEKPSSSAPELSPFQGQPKKDAEMDKLVSAEAEAAREVSRLVAEYKQTEDDAERKKIKDKL